MTSERGPLATEPPLIESDGAGATALVLVESLIHGLITTSTLTPATAIEIIERAVEVRGEMGEQSGEDPASLLQSLTTLSAMSRSLEWDLDQRQS